MKKLIVLLALALGVVHVASAQRSYVNVVAKNIYSSVYQELFLTGELPAEGEVIVLSRIALYPGAIERVTADDQEAVEVARYNLQGVPVDKDEKGIQIVVYSNYTTKTVIVE